MKTKKLKLNVKKETIAKLNTNELIVVKGGVTEYLETYLHCGVVDTVQICRA
ncbi:MAG: hypothetical protein GQ564_07900 [Bacteroidales bacterium]|nr:hypothetical protein [Bacteroidales bacterium]